MKRIRKKIFRPGIYTLTNPDGEVYIGQTKNLDRRKKEHIRYSNGSNDKSPRLITNSLLKFGFDAHVFEIIIELPKDVSREVLKQYEFFVYEQYLEAGYKLLNLQECGTGKIVSEESIKLMSEGTKKMWTDDFRKNHIAKRIGKPIHSEEEKKKRSILLSLRRQSPNWKNYQFTKEDTAKGQAGLKRVMAERGYIVHPDIIERLRQNKSRIILDTNTGVFYFGCLEAAKFNNHTEDNLRKKLNGQYKNNTSLIFA